MESGAAIGGYFELELGVGGALHCDKLAVNTGRNALRYILQAQRPEKLLLPRYLCEAVIQPVVELGVPYAFYEINDQLEPVQTAWDASATVLYINYFGIKNKTVRGLAEQKAAPLIVDNTQAFFSPALTDVPTFYSARKFFGVPDGAYVSGCHDMAQQLEIDCSHERFEHLLKRIDLGAEAGFADYQNHERMLSGLPLRQMSHLTARILSAVDYQEVTEKRRSNYQLLHTYLASINEAQFVTMLDDDSVPMAYPFLCRLPDVRKHLLRNKIFCSVLWPNVLQDLADTPTCIEHQLASHLIPLPVDQRYGENEMMRIVAVIKKAFGNG